MLAVPADATRQERARAASRRLGLERSFDAPIMRHIEDAPRSVVTVQLLSVLNVPFEKTPAGVEVLAAWSAFLGVAGHGMIHGEE